MRDIALVFLGGGLGSILRFILGRWINTLHVYHFPWGTLIVNISACLLLGFIIGFADHRQALSVSSRLFWTIGFCGGFSTFSTFSQEVVELLHRGFSPSATLYIVASIALCGLASFAGLWVGQNT